MVIILGGVVALVIGLLGMSKWWIYFVHALQSMVPAMLIIAGLVAIAVGISSIKDQASCDNKDKPGETK